MRNYELIKKIHDWTPSLENFTEGHREQLNIDQLFDRCLDVIWLIETERPELVKDKDLLNEPKLQKD